MQPSDFFGKEYGRLRYTCWLSIFAWMLFKQANFHSLTLAQVLFGSTTTSEMYFKSKPLREHWHEVLGVSDDATRDEIKAAYKKLALSWHPDRHTDDKNLATAKFVEISNAYRIIMRERHFELANVPVHDLDPVRPPFHTRSSTGTESSAPRTRDSSATLGTLSSSSRQSSFESVTTAPSLSRFSLRHTSLNCDCDALPYIAHGNSSTYPRVPESISNVLESHHFRSSGERLPIFSGALTDSPLQTKLPNLPRRSTGSSNFSEHILMKQTPSLIDVLTTDNRPLHPPYNPPFASIGVGTSKEWRYSLTLTLEELFQGRICPIRITRRYLSGERKNVVLDVDVPPGSQPGAELAFRGVGHERSPGKFQDIVFVIGEASHDRFVRAGNDLLMDTKIPWSEHLKDQDGRLCFPGIDGKLVCIRIPRPRNTARGSLTGSQIVCEAGMPIWFGAKIVGRGNLIVRWEIQMPQTSRWDHFRTSFSFYRR
ncbi:hypothetical protein J3R30DRAFT_3485849 [Lentinula aciculospora]|uniref:J domain-containing protein n=1 Tax=Lentinula aciculospora TaxID=153920 RepID=A0A9W9A9A0_9AGAR|nr:hypothetical protein J3R30DRAFT_3485849 [Lentinula aciculospora]